MATEDSRVREAIAGRKVAVVAGPTVRPVREDRGAGPAMTERPARLALAARPAVTARQDRKDLPARKDREDRAALRSKQISRTTTLHRADRSRQPAAPLLLPLELWRAIR